MKALSTEYQIFDKFTFYIDYSLIVTDESGAKSTIELMKQLGATINIIADKSVKIPISENFDMISDHCFSSSINKLSNILNKHSVDELSGVYYFSNGIYDSVTAQYIKTIIPMDSPNALGSVAHYFSTKNSCDNFMMDAFNSALSDITLYYGNNVTDRPYSSAEPNILIKLMNILTFTHMYKNEQSAFESINAMDDRLVIVDTVDNRNNFCRYLTSEPSDDESLLPIIDPSTKEQITGMDKLVIKDLYITSKPVSKIQPLDA